MRGFICFALIMMALLASSVCQAEIIGGTPYPRDATVGPGVDVSVDYLMQARAFRDQGRYELSRQAYAQALSTCRNNGNLEVIKREMAGVELLIRTMR